MIVNDTSKDRRSNLALAIVLAVLQLALVPNVALLGGRANLALVFVACACLGGDVRRAPAVGFFAGLFYDLAGTGPIGLMALLLTIAGFALAAADRTRVSDDPTGSLALFVPLALVVGIAYGIVLLASGQSSSVVEVLFQRALPGAALDCVAFALVGFLLARLTPSTGPLGGPAPSAKGRGGRYSTRGL